MNVLTAQRVALFVDVQNMFYSAKLLHQSKIDYDALLKGTTRGRQLVRAIAYIVQKPDVNQAGFHEALTRQGYDIRIKELKIREDENGRSTAKGSWDCGLTVDAITMANKIDVAVICSGNGDYLPLVDTLQHSGVKVEVVSFERSTAGDLISSADEFIPIGKEWMFVEKKFQQKDEPVVEGDPAVYDVDEDNIGNKAHGVLS